jgi:hypothetical protein
MLKYISLNMLKASIFFVLMVTSLDHLGFYTVEVRTTRSVFDTNLNKSVNVTSVSLSCTSSVVMGIIADVKVVFLRSYIPFSLMFVMNIFTTRRFIQSKKNAGGQTRSMKREHNFTRTVIFMDMAFFIFYLPWSIWYKIKNNTQINYFF